MSNEATYPLAGSNVPGGKILYFQVLPNGSSTPTIGENAGKICSSVGRTGTGVLTATLSDTYLAAGAWCQLQLATAADSQVQVTTFPVASTKVLTMTILTAGSAADISANAGNIIHVFVFCRDSSAQ